ncbi:terpenoid synthase [Trametes versicolor FP-101664 SS1]|uniref:terpenoid synthase n=1 Tax=Trametes versicolor (strain FP-101664) TaxID=717944 RepID=UPI0004622731|nr:terpenoid synthase [Trametes versicolor FP-101664 SS1]EIW57365.1 terpenoid synthase [Trametes versicolor FP-101664 SS1]BDI63116.1 sesquiterpene synthase [Trametes versicolor]
MSSPSSFVLPDLHAVTPFKGSFNPHYPEAAAESSEWVNSYKVLSDKKRAFFLQGGSELLCAHAYPYAGYQQFRTTCDFVNLLFTVDEISDDQNGKGAYETGLTFYNAMSNPAYDDGTVLCKMTKEFTARLLEHCGPQTYRRFIKHCKDYIEAVAVEADLRERGEVLDLEAYQTLRRENSAVRFCFGLAGYALGIDLPDEVVEHPAFMAMHLSTVDMVCWSNDLYSYNMEQAMGHTGNNVITVLMQHKGLDLQGAADYTGVHFKGLIDTFLDAKRSLPSWGPKLDGEVAQYAMAMETWVIGNLNWSFETQRYFGHARHEIKRTRVVQLYPRRIVEESSDEEDN